MSFIDDADKTLRIQALKALAREPSEILFAALEKLTTDHKLLSVDSRIQKELLAAYARAGGTRGLGRLSDIITKRKLLGRGRWEPVRVNAVYALAEIKSLPATEMLERLREHAEDAVKSAAAQVLQKLTDQNTEAKEEPDYD